MEEASINTHYTYFFLLAISIAGPLALSFDKKVAFYTKWKFLFPAMILPVLFYIVWDIIFTKIGIWEFNPVYNIGFYLYNLPIEEILFFIIVPYCCLFIYECIRCYFPNLKNKVAADIFLKILAMLLFVVAIIFYKKYYTSFTFIFNAIFIAFIYWRRQYFKAFDAVSFLVSYAIILIPFLIVNGFLTALPVVKYNHAQNLGIKIYTIPFEDTFYGMLLILMIVVGYEKLKAKI